MVRVHHGNSSDDPLSIHLEVRAKKHRSIMSARHSSLTLINVSAEENNEAESFLFVACDSKPSSACHCCPLKALASRLLMPQEFFLFQNLDFILPINTALRTAASKKDHKVERRLCTQRKEARDSRAIHTVESISDPSHQKIDNYSCREGEKERVNTAT